MKKREFVIIHTCKGEALPRNKHGVKPGYMPCACRLHTPKRGEGEAHRSSVGRSGNRKEGFVAQVNYNVPIGAPAHVSKEGKAYSSVYHRWSSPGNIPLGNANLFRSAIASVGKEQGQRKPKKSGKTVFGQQGQRFQEPIRDDEGNVIGMKPVSMERDKEAPEVFGVSPRGRQWAHQGKPEDVYPHGNRRKK